MPIYKFRAEVRADVYNLLPLIRSDIVKTDITPQFLKDGMSIPDVEVEIELKSLTLSQLKAAMKKVVDGHVMWQTVQPIELYTGERF